MLKRTLTALALIAATSLAASAREPVVIKAKSGDKDQSRIVSDTSLKPQKFVDYLAAETP
jgi:hypothetical protein